MAKGSVNKAIIVGRLGNDPEIRHTPGGSQVANFNVATNSGYKDKDGNWQERTEWHRIVMWGKEGLVQYLTKGKPVYIEGRIETRSWEQDGVTKYTTEIVAQQIELLDSGGEGQQAPKRVESHNEPEPPMDDDNSLPF